MFRPRWVLWGMGSVEALVLALLGASPAVAVLAAAPPPLAILHDQVLVMALPVSAPVAIALWLSLVAARALVIGGRQGALLVLGLHALLLAPSSLVIAAGLTGVPYLVVGVVVLTLAVTGVTAEWVGFAGPGQAFGRLGIVVALGALAGAAPPVLDVVVASVGAWLGARATAELHGRPRVTGTSGHGVRSLRMAGGVALALGLGTAAGYALVGDSTSAGAAPAAGPDELVGAPVLLVDGFNTRLHRRFDLGLSRPVEGFSYAGLDDDGEALPYTAADTAAGIEAAVPLLAAQVSALAERHGISVTVVGVSEGALVARTAAARGLLDGIAEGLVLVDLPPGVRYLSQDNPATRLGVELTSWLVETLTPLSVDPTAGLPHELEGCALPAADQPLPLAEVRLRSTTDALLEPAPRPLDVALLDHLGAHALTARLGPSRAALATVLQDQPVEEGWLWHGVATLLTHAGAPWRLPVVEGTCP